jgi:predicted nucleotidyltransferase
MKLVYRHKLDGYRKKLIEQINAKLNIESYQGCVLFDNNDYHDYPNPKWRCDALYLNVLEGGVEEISPDYIVKIMRSRNCHNFIWISKKAIISEPIHMVWVYSHELRHMIIAKMYPRLSKMTRVLNSILSGVRQIEIPEEFEAELAAKDIVCSLFGEERYKDYIERQCKNLEASAYFQQFYEVYANWGGDPVAESIKKIVAVWAESEPLITKAYIFGSRARDDYREDSDLDVAIEIEKLRNDENILATWITHKKGLEESLSKLIPYKLHLELCDREKTPTVLSGIEKSNIVVYIKK